MGSRLISMSAKAVDRDLLLDELGLVTAPTEAWFEEEIAGAPIGDWYVVQVMNRSPFRSHIDDRLLARLSARGEVAVCGVYETNMSSFVSAWRGGHELWSVLHELNLDPRHLASEGDVPPELAAFVKEACDLDPDDHADEAVDYLFDVPIDLYKRLTGFCHDAVAMDELAWEALREKSPTPPSDEADRYMVVEDKPATHWPLGFQARAAINAMTPRGGPGFLILQAANGDYMQAAGGDGAYLAEWREQGSGAFRHFAAGREGAVIPGEIKIPTNGAHVLVRWNEKLSAVEVKRLATAFLSGEPRPDCFVWRDISGTFE